MSKINRKFFFMHVRQHLFNGSLKQSQVDGMTIMLDYWEENHAQKDDRWLAYLLGTVFLEVDKKMQPIHEYGTRAYFNRNYSPPPTGQKPRVARQLGNTQQEDGNTFHGRGFVQITGRRNYTDWSRRLDVDLVGNPELALDTKISTIILFEGAILGTFTGKKLGDYFNATKEDWVNARRVINGTNKAEIIAGFAKQFYAAISYTTG